MTIKMNISLFLFALMMTAIMGGFVMMLPVSLTSTFPSFADPSTMISSLIPPANFGMGASIATFSCTIGALYFDCIGTPILMGIEYLLMGVGMIGFVATFLFAISTFFLTSGLVVVILLCPLWIAMPLSVLILAIDCLVILDAALLVRGMLNI